MDDFDALVLAERAAHAKWLAARAALDDARQLRRLNANRERELTWIERQVRAAAPDDAAPRVVTVRQSPPPPPIRWNVICDTKEGLSQLGMLSRRIADAHARGLRSRGHVVRVLQA